MAVTKHLNGTPRLLMEKIRRILDENGLLLEVPNIAEFSKRIKFLFGCSPLAAFEHYFSAEYFFAGHNREVTVQKVRFLLEQTGFRTEYIECYDYADLVQRSLSGRLVNIFKKVVPVKNKKQLIIVKGRLR